MSGMELAIASGAATLLGTAAQLKGQKLAAQEQSRAAAFESEQLRANAEQYRINAEQQKTAAAQDEADRRNELVSSLETLQVLRAGRGVGLTSPTGEAIIEQALGKGEGDILTSRANYLAKADQSRRAAELSRRASEMALRKSRVSLLAGEFAQLGTLAEGGFKLTRIAGTTPFNKASGSKTAGIFGGVY